jgi:hypothetical protein
VQWSDLHRRVPLGYAGLWPCSLPLRNRHNILHRRTVTRASERAAATSPAVHAVTELRSGQVAGWILRPTRAAGCGVHHRELMSPLSERCAPPARAKIPLIGQTSGPSFSSLCSSYPTRYTPCLVMALPPTAFSPHTASQETERLLLACFKFSLSRFHDDTRSICVVTFCCGAW